MYFNLEPATALLAGWVCIWLNLLGMSLQRILQLARAGRLSAGALVPALLQFYPLFYGAWAVFNYVNDRFYVMLPSQVGVRCGLGKWEGYRQQQADSWSPVRQQHLGGQMHDMQAAVLQSRLLSDRLTLRRGRMFSTMQYNPSLGLPACALSTSRAVRLL